MLHDALPFSCSKESGIGVVAGGGGTFRALRRVSTHAVGDFANAGDAGDVREHITAFFNEHGIDFNHNKWQVSNRQLKVKKPNTRGEFIKTEALWIECTEDIVAAIRAAFRLITPKSVADSAYPLLWNLLFVQSSRFM